LANPLPRISSRDDTKKIDLLPQLADKALLVKECAPPCWGKVGTSKHVKKMHIAGGKELS